MSIKFACDCGKAYKVPDKFSGKRVKCKQCGEAIRVPSESQAGVASARASAVSKRSVLKSQRVDKATSRRSSRSSRTSGRTSARISARTSAKVKRAKPGAKTERVKVVDLIEGNAIKQYRAKKTEEFKRGEGRLTFFEGTKPVKAFRLSKKGTVVGRSERCGVTLELSSVSDEHMKLEYKLGTFITTDLQSKNGVVVNGRSIRRCSLKRGDVIQLGDAVLRFDC
jgi:hypothetical protein